MTDQLNYVEVDFIQKELKDRIQSHEESHYAEVVCHIKPEHNQPIAIDEETVYRLKCDYKFEKSKFQAKAGDVFLSKERPTSNGFITGLLLQVTAKNNFHPNISIPMDKLIPHIAAKSSAPKMDSSPLYEDMSDIKSRSELDTLARFFSEFTTKAPPSQPVIPAPSLEKAKTFTKQKLQKLKSDCKRCDEEVAIIALSERKSTQKEKDSLTFKRKQTGALIFSATSGWWLVKLFDGATTTVGWVPRDHWRIIPENLDDDLSSSGYRPWLALNMDAVQLERKLCESRSYRSFLFLHDKREEVYMLFIKLGEVHKFTVNILPDKRLVCMGRYFQTLDNLVLYFKRVPFKVDGTEFTLGSPYADD